MLITDLTEFIDHHRPHGGLIGDATEPTERGYLLTVTCSCGVVFQRWITPEDAIREMIESSLLAFPN